MPGEFVVREKITNEHVFRYMFGMVKIRHRLSVEHITGETMAASGRGDYVHRVSVIVLGEEVFSMTARTRFVAEICVNGGRLVGDKLVREKRL